MSKPRRNGPCPCGSGLKYKLCHGDIIKQATARNMANKTMAALIIEEKKKKGLIKYKYYCNNCNENFDKPKESQIAKCQICPYCDSTEIKEN